jgi:hypothetical protein
LGHPRLPETKETVEIKFWIEGNAGQKIELMEADGEAFIGRASNEEFMVFDKKGGLDPKESIPLARSFMRESGCDIVTSDPAISINGVNLVEIVKVKNPDNCLPELK